MFRPYYYKKAGMGEVDFLIEFQGSVLPIEVKSGKNVSSHKALDNLLAKEEYHLDRALVISADNLHQEGKITYLPMYMTYLIRERGVHGHVDLTILSDIMRGER